MNRDRRKWLNKASALLNALIELESWPDNTRDMLDEVFEIIESILEDEQASFDALESANLDQTPNGVMSAEAVEMMEAALDELRDYRDGQAAFDDLDLEQADAYVLAAVDC